MKVFGEFLLVFHFVRCRRYRTADANRYFSGPNEYFSLWQDVMRAGEPNRNNRYAGLYGQGYGSGLEWLQLSAGAAGAFREDQHGCPRGDLLGSPVQAFQGLSPMGTVDGDDAGPAHGRTEKGDAEQFFFGDPAEVMGEIALEAEDIELAGMVADKYVGLVGAQVFRADDSYPDTGGSADSSAPCLGKYLDFARGFSNQDYIDEGQYAGDKGQEGDCQQKKDGT